MMFRFLPAQGKLGLQQVLYSRVWRDFRVMLSNQKSVFTQLVATWFVARQAGLKVGGKTVSIAFELSNISEQIARTDVLATHMANLPTFIFILLFIVFWGAESSMIKVLLFGLEIETPVF